MALFLESLKTINIISVAVRLVLSLLAGILIGLERGKNGRAAGLRTHILVAIGSAMASLLGIFMTSSGAGDPSRIASGVVSGIGFLGAGIILVRAHTNRVTGLTTAAAMWATSAIGLAFGAGFYEGALIGTLLVFLALTLMTRLEVRQKGYLRLFIEIDDANFVNHIVDSIHEEYENAHDVSVHPAQSGIQNHVCVSVSIATRVSQVEVLRFIRALDHVIFVVKE